MDRVREGRPPLYEILKSGLEDSIAWSQGERELRVTVVPIPGPPPHYDSGRILAIRQKLKLSQSGFARLLNVSLKTIQSWEQGNRLPSHAAARLLQFVESPDSLVR